MITIKDIAKITGYSTSTVSAVLGGRADNLGIKQETRQIIMDTSQKMGYRRSNLALQMQSGCSKTIIQFIPDLVDNIYTTVALRATNAAIEHGYTLRQILYRKGESIEKALEYHLGHWPLAFLVWGDIGDNYKMLAEYSKRYNIPIIVVDIMSPYADLSILTDDRQGIAETVEYLYQSGYRRVAHATDTFAAQYAKSRYDIYREYISKRGMEFDEALSFHEEFFHDSAKLLEYAGKLVAATRRPQVITCGSDHMAIKLMMILLQHGVKIPEDISLVGYGGLDISRLAIPKITTISQSFDQFGQKAVELTLDYLKNGSIEKYHLLPTSLSTGATTMQYKEPLS